MLQDSWAGERTPRIRRSDPAAHVRMTASDRRKFARGAISSAASLRVGIDSFSAQLIDISEGGARVSSSLVPRLGALLNLQIDGLGLMPARVVRRFPNNFAVEFEFPEGESQSLTAQLADLIATLEREALA